MFWSDPDPVIKVNADPNKVIIQYQYINYKDFQFEKISKGLLFQMNGACHHEIDHSGHRDRTNLKRLKKTIFLSWSPHVKLVNIPRS